MDEAKAQLEEKDQLLQKRDELIEKLELKIQDMKVKHNDYLVKIHPSAAYTTPENAVKYSPIPLHPGTIKYLKEQGVAVPAQLMP